MFGIDNFAGGGGASTGIHMAWGHSPQVAINHDEIALAMHTSNHPDTIHMINDVWEIDPKEVAGGRPVDLVWFSPDCRHHSKAKGGKPVSASVRDLAWVAVKWAKLVKPRVIMLENVEEFQLWGPLTENQIPDKAHQGETFRAFISALEAEGYVVEWKELRACDFGAPTIRKRLFLIARSDGKKIIWPEKTHGPDQAKPWKVAADIINWSIPCPSIFDSSEVIKQKYGLRAKRPLADNTEMRIARGIQKFILESEDPFFIPQNQVVVPQLEKVAAFMAQHNTGVVGRSLQVPLSTVTTTGSQQTAIVANMLPPHGSSRRATDIRKPLSTITAGGGHAALVTAMMVKYYGTATGQRLTEPLHSLTTKGRFGLVTCTLGGEDYAIVDIGMRMLTPREQFRAQGFPEDYQIDFTPDGTKISKSQQTHKCGNSVSPLVVEALVSANLPIAA